MRETVDVFEKNAEIVLQGIICLPCKVIRNKDTLTIEAESGYGLKVTNKVDDEATDIDFFDPEDRELGFEEKSNQILLAIFVDLLLVSDLAQAKYLGEKDLNKEMYKVYTVKLDQGVSYEFYMEEDYRLKAICKVSEGFSFIGNSFIIFKE